jgi:hypothetical protein
MRVLVPEIRGGLHMWKVILAGALVALATIVPAAQGLTTNGFFDN